MQRFFTLMSTPRVRAAVAAARTQAEARRAGGAWNRHDRSALHDALVVGMIVGLPDVKLEYGGLRFRFDLPGAIKNDATSGDEVVVPVEGGDDVQMGGEPDGAPASGATAATSQPAPATPHFADVGPHAGSAASTAAELERLRERAATAAERKKRQATARKQRKASEREALAVYCELPYGDTTTPTKSVKAPLWSQPRCDLKQGFIKLVGEITHRCATEAARTGLSTKACPVNFGGRPLDITVLSGTAALRLTPSERAIDLMVFLSHDPDEEKLARLLRRWSKRGTPSGQG